MNYKPEIAIIESNTLTCLGLKVYWKKLFQWQLSVLSIVSVN